MSILERVRLPNARPSVGTGRKIAVNAESIEESPSKEPKPAGFSNRERFRTAFRMKAYTLRQSSEGTNTPPAAIQTETFGLMPSESAPPRRHSRLLFACLSEGGVLADPALEDRGFPAEILLEEMIPTLKLVIRAVRSAPSHQPVTVRACRWSTVTGM